MFKKAITLLMAATICVSLSVTAFAASETIKSDVSSVTLSEVTSKETKTLKINGKEQTVTVYYCPVGTKVTGKILDQKGYDKNPDNRYGSTYYELNGNEYVSAMGGPGFNFVVGQAEYALESYYVGTKEVFVIPGGAAAPAKPGTPAASTPAAPDTISGPSLNGTTYTVKAGDTLGLLSVNFYGSYDYWDELYKVNATVMSKSDGKIYEGLVISIPETIATGIHALAPVAAGSGEKLYVVQAEDTLSKIASAQYNDVNKYKAIFTRNSDRLVDENTIYAGQIIVLPAL